MFEINDNTTYNIVDVAKSLGIHPWYLRNAAQNGDMKVQKFGGKIFVLGSELRAAMVGGKLEKQKSNRGKKSTVPAEVLASETAETETAEA